MRSIVLYGSNNNLHDSLIKMMEEMRHDERFCPSLFWTDLNKKNLAMLEARGVNNFKRTLSQNYFNWVVGSDSSMYKFIKKEWMKFPTIGPLLSRIERDIKLHFTTNVDSVTLSHKVANSYRLYVSYLWEVMKRYDNLSLHKILYEPEFGNPIKVYMKKRLISQDLANSIIEANVIAELKMDGAPVIAELGAGSGRLCHACVSGNVSGKYFIFDIPPALMVSQWYLSQLYPQKRIFAFRSFDDFNSIENELMEADIAFFTPNQLEKFPSNYFDIFISISTLPEMRRDQIDLYLNLFQRLSRRYIYLKQWKQWTNPTDGTDFSFEDYVLNSNWTTILNRTDPVVPDFFNRVWKKI